MIFGPDWSFVQNPKAGSSAITDALLPFCAPLGVHEPRGWSKHDIPTPGRVPYRTHRLGVVRNPFDRLVSAWSYYCSLPRRDPVTFRRFVLDSHWYIGRRPFLIDFCSTPQTAWLLSCTDILRHETLGEDFPLWASRVLGHWLKPEHSNASPRSGGYAAYYLDDDGKLDDELISTVYRRFGIDCREFHYDF